MRESIGQRSIVVFGRNVKGFGLACLFAAKLVVDIRRESTWSPETKRCEPILRILWSVLILDERKEGWGDVNRRFGAVEPVVCSQEPSLVVHFGKETLFRLFDVVV